MMNVSLCNNKIVEMNIKNILFPHTVQNELKQKPYKSESIELRVEILKCICKYVYDTKRFKNKENIKSKIYLQFINDYDRIHKQGNNDENEIDDIDITNETLNTIYELVSVISRSDNEEQFMRLIEYYENNIDKINNNIDNS